ncbi:MAG: NAD(P)H-dependent flavin oxidoreductase [Desulfovibrionaceae bacterium]
MTFPILTIGDVVARVPIVQGGMGVGISLSGLAAAVANQGGVGVIAAAMIGMKESDAGTDPRGANVRALRKEIRAARAMTKGIIGVNIMVALTDYDELAEASVEEGVDIIFSGAGLPVDLPKHAPAGSHTKLAPIVSSGRAASILCRKWLHKYHRLPDALVVEGPKAGGHLGFKPEQLDQPEFALEILVPEVLAAVRPFEEENKTKIPVIAAGGVYTGADIHRFLRMGAAAVQMGTRFVATHECDADDAFKQSYVTAKADDMVVIKSPVGLPGRAIGNQFITDVANGLRKPFKCPYKCLKTCDYHTAPYCIAMALTNAKRGKLKYGFAFAGANAYRTTRIISVAELIDELRTEYDAAVTAEA